MIPIVAETAPDPQVRSPTPDFRRSWQRPWPALVRLVCMAAVMSLLVISSVELAACDTAPPPPVGPTSVVYIASSGGEVRALRADDGATVWQRTPGGDPHCAPLLDHGVLYVDEPDLLQDTGRIYAFDARTGTVRWTYAYAGITSSMLLAGGVLYAAAGSFTAQRGAVFALQASDGTQVWLRSFIPYEPVLTAIQGDVVYGGTVAGAEVALDAHHGALLWQTAARPLAAAPPTLSGDTLYVAAADALLALSARDGSLRWQQPQPVPINAQAPVVAGGVVYVASNALAAYRAADGTLLWRTPPLGDGLQAPVVVVGVGTGVSEGSAQVYVGTDQHPTLYALDSRTGVIRWIYPMGGDGMSPPTVVGGSDGSSGSGTGGGTIYVGGAPEMVALHATDGTRRWSFSAQPSVLAAPVVQDGVVYVTTAGNYYHPSHVLALRASDGARLWAVEVGPNLDYPPLLGPLD